MPTVKPRRPGETEAGFTKTVLDLAARCGWRRAHFRPGRVLRGGVEKYETPVAADGKGWPDLCLVRGGRLVFAELKMPGTRATPEQTEWLTAMTVAGAETFVWRPADWPEIERVLAR